MPIAKAIKGTTRRLGPPKDWRTENPCTTLNVRDVITPDGAFMITAWEFTAEEVQQLKDGETLKLWIRGHDFPVIALTVGEIVE